VWDLESGLCLRTLEGHTDVVSSVSVTPDGKRAISGSWDKSLRVWDLESGRCLRTLRGHTNVVRSVSVTPDGRRAVSGSWDESLRVWDLESGRCLRTLEGHTNTVESVSVTPDGKRAASGSSDESLRVWDLESGRCVAAFQANEGVGDAKMTANGVLVCGTTAGEVLFVTCHGLKAQPPLATPGRIWLHGEETHSEGSHPMKPSTVVSRWEDSIETTCPWCGQRFQVEEGILNVIRDINRSACLNPDQSPCLELPAETWDDSRLLSECPLCHKPLKFNPFILDNRERY
jgi:hypothetical protein